MQKCENCKHEDRCKWCDSMKAQQNEVSKIVGDNINSTSPISIYVDCSKFEKVNIWSSIDRG